MDKYWSSWHLEYYDQLSSQWPVIEGVELLQPFKEKSAQKVRSTFYQKYYNDYEPRQLWLGINPGRFGAGITGIPFSDPMCLAEDCGIKNPWQKRQELSAQFIFSCIREYGGAERFYQKVYIDSICPLGLLKEGLNFNYYDDKSFFKKVKSTIEKHLSKLHQLNFTGPVVIIGKGKNEKFFNELTHPFTTYKSLPHPRWIMQYKRKDLKKWINTYLETIES